MSDSMDPRQFSWFAAVGLDALRLSAVPLQWPPSPHILLSSRPCGLSAFKTKNVGVSYQDRHKGVVILEQSAGG